MATPTRWVFVVTCTMVWGAYAGHAEARSARTSQVPNGSAASCGTCHAPSPPSLNPFGQTVAAGFLIDGNATATLSDDTVDWGPALAALDSDDDGYPNGLELGDPEGAWTAGDTNPQAPVSNPGAADSNLCGTGMLEGNEPCDGDALGDATCASLGFDGGELGCLAGCVLDTSGCTGGAPDPDVVQPELDAGSGGPDAGDPGDSGAGSDDGGDGGGCSAGPEGGSGAAALLLLLVAGALASRRFRGVGAAASLLVVLVGVGCSGDDGPASEDTGVQVGADVGPDSGGELPDVGGDVAGGEADIVEVPPAVGICGYTNPFSQGAECKEYSGAGWTAAAAEEDCGQVLPGTAGEFTPDARCVFESALGRCSVEGDGDTDYVLVSAGEDAGQCGAAQVGCELFGGGTFAPDPLCDGSVGPGPGGGYGDTPFVQPYLACKDPLPGEPPGNGPNGQVCTWTIISGCTEPGRKFDDYASCEDVLTQRPYYAAPDEPQTAPDDPRLDDPAYMAEAAWVREQVEACACICCHSTRTAPDGPSMWWVEAEPIWLDSVADSGLSMMAGLSASDALGAVVPAEDNNGFDRIALGLPTTDIERMRAFLNGEWARRGFTPEDGAAFPAFGGPIVDQQRYVPSACADGEGVDAAGAVTWTGGEARYVYVLPEGAANPGVPPNLDEPEGTVWFVDVPTEADPLTAPLTYGEVSGDARQRVPADGAPPALTSGETYYLYVLKDIGFPITRCLFEAP